MTVVEQDIEQYNNRVKTEDTINAFKEEHIFKWKKFLFTCPIMFWETQVNSMKNNLSWIKLTSKHNWWGVWMILGLTKQ